MGADLVSIGVRAAARHSPDKPALVCGERRLAFAELDGAIDRVGAALRALGLGPGERVAIALPNSVEFLVTFLAAARYRLVALTVPGPSSSDGLRVLARSRAAALVGTPAWLTRLEAWPGFPGSLRLAVAVGGAPRRQAHSGVRVLAWQDLLAMPPRSDGRGHGEQPAPEDLFYIGYTSGSTGQPKGVARSHRAWALSFRAAAAAFGLTGEDGLLVAGPLHFSASLFHACQMLELGGTVYLEARFDPRRVRDNLAQPGVSAAFMVPTQYRAVTGVAPGPGAAVHLRTLISCGEKLTSDVRAALARAFPEARIYEYYGSSELGFTAFLPPGADAAGSVGRPFPGVEVCIRRGDGRPAGAGEPGLLYARSPMMASGYDRGGVIEPIADAEGWATAGDLARVDAGGFIYLLGRSDGAINTGGAKVYPAEVEEVLASHPAVAEAAVFAADDPLRGQRVAAAVVPRPGRALSPGDLRAWCARRLSAYKRPRAILIVRELPRTASGKVDRRALGALLRERGQVGGRPV